jgi:hypothetical protein
MHENINSEVEKINNFCKNKKKNDFIQLSPVSKNMFYYYSTRINENNKPGNLELAKKILKFRKEILDDDDFDMVDSDPKNYTEKALQSLELLFTKNSINHWNFDLADKYVNYTQDKFMKYEVVRQFAKGAVGTASMVKSKTGEILILKEIFNIPKPLYLPVSCFETPTKLFSMTGSIGYEHIVENLSMKTNTNIYYMVSIKADNFSNQTLINLILIKILKNNINYVAQLDSYYTFNDRNYTGNTLMKFSQFNSIYVYIQKKKEVKDRISREKPDEVNEYTLNAAIVLKMIRDICYPLVILKQKKYGFVHADMKPGNIFLASEIPNPPADDLIVYKNDFKVIAQLADFDKSSIFFNNVRFYNDINILKEGLFKTSIKEVIKTFGSTRYDLLDCAPGYYILKNLIPGMYPNLVVNGLIMSCAMHYQFSLPLSYDIYVFIIGLILIPDMHSIFMNDQDLLKIWKSLWFDDDFEEINNKISTIKNKKDATGMPEIVDFLAPLKLKVDISDFYKNVLGDDIYYSLIDTYTPPLKKIIIGRDNHICLSPCIQKKCSTPKFSRRTSWGFFGTKTEIKNEDDC